MRFAPTKRGAMSTYGDVLRDKAVGGAPGVQTGHHVHLQFTSGPSSPSSAAKAHAAAQ